MRTLEFLKDFLPLDIESCWCLVFELLSWMVSKVGDSGDYGVCDYDLGLDSGYGLGLDGENGSGLDGSGL